MARKSLPVITITIIMLLVLATAGVAYGLWSEELIIDGTVNTGNVDVEFSGPYFVNEYVKIGKYFYHEPWWKDVTTCEAFLGDYAPEDGDVGEFLTVNVTGAYPGYYCSVMFDIHSSGTVPVHVTRPMQVDGPDWVNVHTCYPNWVQLHEGDSVYGWVVITFDNYMGVEENGEYTFAFDIDAWQWNEAPPTDLTKEASNCFEMPELLELTQ